MAFIPNQTNSQTYPTLTPNGMGNLPMPKNGPTPVTPPSPMGAQAPSPQKNLKKPINTLPQTNQTGTANGSTTGQTATSANNGLIGDPNLFQKGAQAQYDYGTKGSPEINKDISDITNFKNQYNDYNNRFAQSGFTGNLTGLEANAKNYYENRLGNLQSQLSNDTAIQQQKLGSLSSATSASAPRQNGYALLNPFNNQPVGGTGGGGGNSLNNIASWGAGIDYSGQATKAANDNDINISSARSQGQALQRLLQSSPDYNSNPVNLWNTVVQDIQGNVSNPRYPQIQSSVKEIISNYAQILNTDPNSLLIQGAQAPSLMAFLQNLDDLANSRNSAIRNKAAGGGISTASPFNSAPQTRNSQTQPPQTGTLRSPDGKSEVNLQDLTPTQIQEARQNGWK